MLNIWPTNGSYSDGTVVSITLSGTAERSQVTVYFGNHSCTVSGASAGVWYSLTTTILQVPLCSFESSTVPVYVSVGAKGYALKASPYDAILQNSGAAFQFTQELVLDSLGPLKGSFYGGTEITLRGAGFSTIATSNLVTICRRACEVISSSRSEIKCYAPAAPFPTSTFETVRLRVGNSGEKPGLKAEFFYFKQGESSSSWFQAVGASPDPSGRIPDLVREDLQVSYTSTNGAWPGLAVTDNFAVQWTGQVKITLPGFYVFSIQSDDGSKMYLDGELFVETTGMRTRSGSRHMFAGRHSVKLLYYEGGGGAGMTFRYSGPDSGYVTRVVPPSVLSCFSDDAEQTLSFTYEEASAAPQVTKFVEDGGTHVELHGLNFGNQSGRVAFGSAATPSANLQCLPETWNNAYVRCRRPDPFPAGEWLVRLWSPALGWSDAASSPLVVHSAVTAVAANGAVAEVNETSRWSLAMKVSDGSILGFSSEYWTNWQLLNEQSPVEEPTNAKYEEFTNVPFKRMRMCIGSPHRNCVEHTFASIWPSAKELFSAGEIRDKDVSQVGILRAFAPTRGSYRDCPMQEPGFNIECRDGNKARWGYCAACPSRNCQADGGDADATIGVGLAGQNTGEMGAGWTQYFASGAGSCSANSKTSKNAWIWLEMAHVNATQGTLETGFGGGEELELRGSGLGLQPAQTQITVCGAACAVTFSNGTHARCTTAPRNTEALVDAYPEAFPDSALAPHASRFYTERGAEEAWLSKQAYMSPVDEQITYASTPQPTRNDCWFGFELSPDKRARLSAVAFFPPTDPNRRIKVQETVWEARNLSDTSWTVVMSATQSTVTGFTIQQGWNTFELDEAISAQAFRIRLLPDVCKSTGDLMRGARFYGTLMESDDSGACPIEIRRISHPLATGSGAGSWVPVSLVHTLERTPVVTHMTPNRGSARGGTVIQLQGSNLQPLDAAGSLLLGDASAAATRVNLNGYACSALDANGTRVSCTTLERDQGIFMPSTILWLAGKGNAIIAGNSEVTTFKYIDKWSDVHSWLDSEPPVDGDTVFVPEGQAILLDQDSPKLFLVIVSGWLEFDRKDLAFDATYIWVAGGHFQVGSEVEPFLHQATITLHGDRWNTIELPFIGSKMLTVTNLGGLHGGCHIKSNLGRGQEKVKKNPCEVRSVGKLDLHGRPDTSWTHIIKTASPGDSSLELAEPVAWLVGSKVVITPSQRGQDEEVRSVKAVRNGGTTVDLDEPLTFEHLGTWFHHEGVTPTDLRAAVGLQTKNVKIQGDEKSLLPGNSYLFGAHVGAFFGGEMRIENTEFTRTGQAANFGRYSSHWHVLGGGRNVDVVDNAYLRNNSYHDTFQRAVVVHATDYAVVRDNVAHKTHGHSYFTEAGDEDYTLFEHNLAVHPLPHHLLLDDDTTPAGFWLPGFMGWHRNNMVANAARGWRVRKVAGVASGGTDLTFFNNTVHASGFGWHLKPPMAPPTLNNFKTFTAFRCGTGMFYYSTGNIFHDDHRFVECGTGFHMNHLSNGLQTAPFFHNVVLIGNIDRMATQAMSGVGLSGPKDDEYWYTSGVTVINYHNTAAFHHCWETACTVRYERARFFNSPRRTRSDSGLSGIYHDLDGTLTGFRNGFVTWYEPFNEIPGLCQRQAEHVNGIVCGRDDGSARLRRLYLSGQQPWQLDGKSIQVQTPYGSSAVPFTFKKLYGWAVPVVSGIDYDLKINDPNDFQKLSLQYSQWDYVLQEHGFNRSGTPFSTNTDYTRCTPQDESVKVHLNYTDWRDHFNDALGDPYGPVLEREPTVDDPFGAYAVKLWKDQCDLYIDNPDRNLSAPSAAICDGGYHNSTGLALKYELDTFTTLPQVNGRLTMMLTTKVFLNHTDAKGVNTWLRRDGHTPAGGLMQRFSARECPEEGCATPPPPVFREPEKLPVRLWSDASRWPNGRLPQADENVVISATDSVELDIHTPVLHWLTIEGVVNFSRTANATLNVKSVKLWGILDIGTDFSPIPRGVTATVAMHGDLFSHTVIMAEGLFLVNKVIAVMGELTAVGTPLEGYEAATFTKLHITAGAGATELTVKGDVSSWPVGASVGVSPTEFPSPPADTEAEVRTIVSEPVFDNTTGTSTFRIDAALSHRHFAGVVSTPSDAGHWPKVELAATVTLLEGRSNVVFRTAEADSTYGGYVNVGGSADGKWAGSAIIRSVDFVGMGKHEHQQPALKFNFLGRSQAKAKRSIISRCVFSRSQAGAIEANGASDLEIVGNAFHKTYRTAVWIAKTCEHDRITVQGNLALETLRHPKESLAWHRPFAAFLLEVRPLVLRGNVAAGSTESGFVLRPQLRTCVKGDSGMTPLAESDLNEAVGCVTGVFLLRACQAASCDSCALTSGFVIWKSSHAGITTVDQSANVRLESIVLADNHIGVSFGFLRPTSDMAHRVYAHNMTVFGSTPASVCGKSTECRSLGTPGGTAAITGAGCFSVIRDTFRRVGLLTYIVNNVAKLCEANPMMKQCRPPNTPVKPCLLPWDIRVGSLGSRYSESHWDGVTFGHFQSDDCGRPSVAFTHNPTAKDFTYPSFFSGVRWLSSVDAGARANLNTFQGASAEDDAVSNLALIDVDGSFMGADVAGTVVPIVNPALATAACHTKPNYFICPQLKLRLLKWEAVAGPAHRVLGNMKLWRESDGQATWSRGPYKAQCLPGDPEQDRGWMVKPNEYYNMTLFASPPKHHRLFYFNDDPDGLRIALFLSQPFKLQVYVDGKMLPEADFDTSQLTPARYPTLDDPHGSYAFDPHERRFYLTMKGGTYSGRPATLGGGFVLLRLLLVVQLSLTVSVPLLEFDSKSMIENVALLLKIDPSRIKIVSVQSRAQVAAGGRRLREPIVSRRLSNSSNSSTAILVQISEKSPPPLPSSAFAGATPDYAPTPIITPDPNASVPNATTVAASVAAAPTSDDSFSVSSMADMKSIAAIIQKEADAGTLAASLKVPVVLEQLETADPTVAPPLENRSQAPLPVVPKSTTVAAMTKTTTMTTTTKKPPAVVPQISPLAGTPKAILGTVPKSLGAGPSSTDVVGIVVGVVVGLSLGAGLTASLVYQRLYSERKLVQVAPEFTDVGENL
jgi:hypothetical protein